MLSTALATLSTLAARPDWGDRMGYGMGMGWSAGWLFLLIPLFWILVFGILFAIFGRRWRRGMRSGAGMHPGWQQAATDARSAEKTLAERFAQGDIDEVEYRARLEVLRANRETPPTSE
ncbi:hypothetical protein D6T64_03440 [Cryobacterium melibiosiphilum]|uniref:SHOCT domain-containing protein n=1 Tax=Cryobacterium melibiosiphilum TaxID=995039 RepID=A0A3A5N003_9MICO|nr:hypothetical protein [Cryobacterium melibiosiphilum]RJT90684.1 hypothetical protein D6T64_03440 [Cryobacterium melibiosiphilum]